MVVRDQVSNFRENALLIRILDGISTAVLILNSHRQIIFANRAFLELARISDIYAITGLRPGEAIGCIFSGRTQGGCGTTEFCQECGAAKAILSSLRGIEDVQEFRVSLDHDSNALDLRVMTAPIELMGEIFSVFSISDIGNEKRREVLERIFLHDVRNTAGGLQGFTRLLAETPQEEIEQHTKIIVDLADKLFDEIDSYTQLSKAESRSLAVRPVTFKTTELLEKVKNLYHNHLVAGDKELCIDPNAEEGMVHSDETLLFRVIGNMVKNALEAVSPGQKVTLSCALQGENVRFEVRNPGTIPPSARLQIFQRSFSTKGAGRGLGTYSMRLLSEQYLKGQVGFTTSEREGTVFYGIYPRMALLP
jgi:signal transduction histidine kinase